MRDSDFTPPRRRLPDASLTPLSGGDAVPLRARRRGTVLVLLGDVPGDRDGEFLRRLARAEKALREWDGRVLVIAGAETGELWMMLDALRLPFPVLSDAARAVAGAAGVSAPALVITDQWGEVYEAAEVGPERGWPAVEEVEQWLRFLSIRCAG